MKRIDKIKQSINEISLDYYEKNDWAYQYRNCNQNTKRMLRDFLDRVLKPEIMRRIDKHSQSYGDKK